MPALIPELIALASDPAVKTADLLRKALVAARLLQQPDAANWLDHELQGYPDGTPVPPYRQRRGRLAIRMAGTSYLLPVANTERAQQWQTCPLSLPLSELAALAATDKSVRIRFPPERLAQLMAELDTRQEVEISLPVIQVREVIEAVRGRVLNWALELAEAGIQGDEMPSPPQAPVTIIIDGGFHGGQLMVSSPGGQQQQTVTGEQKAADPSGLAQGSVDAPRQPAERDRRQSEPDTLKPQAATAKRKWPLFVVLAGGSALAVLQSAGGGVLSELVLKWLASLSGG